MTTWADTVNFQMVRYWCASKAEQRVEERIKIIILLWANNSQTVSIDSLSGAENWTVLLFFQGKLRPGGHMEISQILQTSICILKYGKDRENWGKEGDLFPITAERISFQKNTSHNNTVTTITMNTKNLQAKCNFKVEIWHSPNSDVLRPHYSHVPYYTSVASAGRSCEHTEPRQS